MLQFVDNATRMLFFTGKGGVGKTSLACAVAVALADRGKRVLLVSTDPASNLGQVFGIEVGEHEPTLVDDVPGLFVLNINPEAAAQAYRDRIIGPMRDALPRDVVQGMEEQLSGACTTEIAAFDEFTELLTGGEVTIGIDHVVFDTAPTGHTLRLLQLPSAWSNFLEDNTSGASCLGPLAGLEKQRERYRQAVAELTNRQHTTFVLVTRPQRGALAEAERTSRELASLGIANQHLIVNGVLPDAGNSNDPIVTAWVARQRDAMAQVPTALSQLPTTHVPLQPRNLVGVAALLGLLAPTQVSQTAQSEPPTATSVDLPPLAGLIDEIENQGHGLVMLLGKGGVGKTTIASAIATELSTRGHAVHLTTTDPAAHLSMTVEANIPGLEVSRIDPQVESELYRQHVLETKGKDLDDAGKALLAEDLRSPCTEEIAVFQAFSRVMRAAREKFVVVDTAPTGHTLLLLDAAGAYHRDLVRHLQSEHVRTPMMQLQDPMQTKMLIVALPETTPVHEAEALQADLRRAGIEPWAWVVNSSLAAAEPSDPLLAARAQEELPHLEHLRQAVSRIAIVPWLTEEPVGRDRLLALTGASRAGA